MPSIIHNFIQNSTRVSLCRGMFVHNKMSLNPEYAPMGHHLVITTQLDCAPCTITPSFHCDPFATLKPFYKPADQNPRMKVSATAGSDPLSKEFNKPINMAVHCLFVQELPLLTTGAAAGVVLDLNLNTFLKYCFWISSSMK